MDAGDALFKMLSGGRSPRERFNRGWVAEAIARAGGVSQLARAIGVHRTTVQGWANKGKEPTLESQELLRVVLRQARMTPRREAGLRARTSITFQGEQAGRPAGRTITLDQRYIRPDTMDKVVTAYLRGAGPSQLLRVMWADIHSAPFYKTLFYPGGVEAQAAAPAPPSSAKAPATGSGGGGGAPAAGGGGYYGGGGEDEFYDEYDDVAYEGWHLDAEYGLGGVSAA